MRIIDVIQSPWAITERMYRTICHVYAERVRGNRIDVAAIEADLGKPLNNDQRRYQLSGDVAVIPIEGVLGKKMNMLMQVSGGSSTQIIAEDFRAALADPEVSSILLLIESPGGTVDGTQDLARLIYESRGEKPIIAFGEDMMASAAYWVGAAADRVYLANGTTNVGSIGVVTTHEDWSKYEEQIGVDVTEIYAGKYKRIVSEHEPLSDDGRQTLQAMVDYVYSVFVDDVARFRGKTPEQVLAEMADGRIFIGAQGVAAGLADGIMSLEQAVEEAHNAAQTTQPTNPFTRGGNQMPPTESTTIETPQLTIDAVRAQYPDIAEALIAEGRTAGAEAERARIQAVEAATLPGHEALIGQLKFDGVTSGDQAAARVLAAEKGIRENMAASIVAEAPEPAPHVASNYAGDTAVSAEDREKQAWDRDPKLQKQYGGDYRAYQAYREGVRKGAIRE